MPLRLVRLASSCSGAVAMRQARSLKSTNTFGAGGAGDYPAFAGPGPQPHEMYDMAVAYPG